MKNIFVLFIAASTFFLFTEKTQAFTSKHWWVGAGFYSENALNQVADKTDGSKGFLGEMNLPLIVRYDWAIGSKSWFLAPQLNFTPLARETEGKTAKVTITQLAFLIGKNAGAFEWSTGLGLLRETIKGNGGTVVLNNGTNTSTFAQPGGEVTVQKVTLNLGTGYTSGRYRYGLDIYILSPFSSQERTQNLMLSVTFDLSGSSKSGG